MKRELLINASPLEVRVALLEDSVLTEFYVERDERRGLAGNIYKGKVVRVLPGMQAAFVDIGLEKAGFLHVSDFLDEVNAFGEVAEEMDDGEVETEPVNELPPEPEPASLAEGEPGAEAQAPGPSRRRRRRRRARQRLPIEQQLKRNQEIIVQIAKEPMGTKGARLTSFVSLPGRHLVYMPTTSHLGVSRRIESAEERARLREAVNEIRPAEGGFIIRTACEGVSKREIQQDIGFLTRLWASIVKKNESSPPASLLYNDLDLALRVIRDMFSSEIDHLRCDDRATHERILATVQEYMPRLRSRVLLYEGDQPIFDQFNVEPQIERALERKVGLKSGGYLVFDQAEALTAIDVNTGRFVGKRSQEETVLKTNLEAVGEVVNQLRLRNIGGIIIVDFIDMSKETNRKRVSEAFGQALKRDRARTTMLKISELGLVQMTRKRTRESLEQLLTEQCPRCDGRRVVKSIATLAGEMLRAIRREASRRRDVDMLMVKLHPEIARYLYDHAAEALEELDRQFGIRVVLQSTEALEPGTYEFSQTHAAAALIAPAGRA
ncbi:MAG TPA: Rne/Rng family ribonuclease [Candidatus Binataceae bacterium]|nr:Rne/Rng family ribonuclease [Candidatus Binataceae bacterium]